MAKFWSLAVFAAACVAASTSVDAQNAPVHPPDYIGESRAATTAPTTKPVTGAAKSTAGAAATPVKPTTGAVATPAKPVVSTAASPVKPAVSTAASPAKPTGGALTTAAAAAAAETAAGPTPRPAPTLSASATWVSNFKAKPKDKLCYRRTTFASNKQCPPGYVFDDLLVCWAQCPIEYPVQCGMECLPQNKDCTLEVLCKVSAVATTAVKLATGGFMGELSTVAKGNTKGVSCAVKLYDAAIRLWEFVDEVEAAKKAGTREQIWWFTAGGVSLDFAAETQFPYFNMVPEMLTRWWSSRLSLEFSRCQPVQEKKSPRKEKNDAFSIDPAPPLPACQSRGPTGGSIDCPCSNCSGRRRNSVTGFTDLTCPYRSRIAGPALAAGTPVDQTVGFCVH